MRKIYRYPLKWTDLQNIFIPAGGKILSAVVIGNELNIYVEFASYEKHKDQINVYLVGTGVDLPEVSNVRYISTVIKASTKLSNEAYVFHVYINEPSYMGI